MRGRGGWRGEGGAEEDGSNSDFCASEGQEVGNQDVLKVAGGEGVCNNREKGGEA